MNKLSTLLTTLKEIQSSTVYWGEYGVPTDIQRRFNDAVVDIQAAIIDAQLHQMHQMATVCAETYQVVGALAAELNIFESDEIIHILDNLSEQKIVHGDILPFVMPAQQKCRPTPEDKGKEFPKCTCWCYSGDTPK